MEKQNGVSMIELVIVLILIVLIASFSVYTGKTALDQATVSEVYTEINSIREAVNSINVKRSLLSSDVVLEAGKHYDVKVQDIFTKSEFETQFNVMISDEQYQNTYIIYGMDFMEEYEASMVRKYYGLDSIKHSYLVNFNDVQVDLLISMKLSDRKVRTFDQIRALVDEGDI